jgi:hypothetical protein
VDPGTPEPFRAREEMRHNFIARAGIPFISVMAGKIGESLARMRFRRSFFRKVGVFLDGYDREGISNPRIQMYYYKLASKRHQRKRNVALVNASASTSGRALGVYPEETQDRMVRVFGSEPAIRTTSKLTFAFSSHRPSAPCTQRVAVIYCHSRARDLAQATSPLNRYFPNKSAYPLGDDHEEAIKSPKTALLLKQLLDCETDGFA